MIKELQNRKIEIATQIRAVFQSSYAVEAELLGAVDFPPLKRPFESYMNSDNYFFGYFENDELAGVVEIEAIKELIDINSLVVDPKYFRRGIGRKLLEYIFDRFEANLFVVETGAQNEPATALYKRLGFKEVKQWDTDFGIRKVQFEKRVGS